MDDPTRMPATIVSPLGSLDEREQIAITALWRLYCRSFDVGLIVSRPERAAFDRSFQLSLVLTECPDGMRADALDYVLGGLPRRRLAFADRSSWGLTIAGLDLARDLLGRPSLARRVREGPPPGNPADIPLTELAARAARPTGRPSCT